MTEIIQNIFLLLLSQINKRDMQKQKIIYIDDELINLSLFHINFRDRFDIIISESPVKAIEIIKEQNIKVIITDYKMPVMNGMELINKVKDFSPDAICMIMTGFPESDVVTDKTKLFKFIMKPFKKAEVMMFLEEAFNQLNSVA